MVKLNSIMTVQEAFDAMIKGKSFRITKEYRKEVIDDLYHYMSDQWFVIQSIHCDETVTLCGNCHTILRNVSLEKMKD